MPRPGRGNPPICAPSGAERARLHNSGQEVLVLRRGDEHRQAVSYRRAHLVAAGGAYGLSQIEEYGGKFDFIVTHDCPSRVLDACWRRFRAHNSIGKVIPGIAGLYLEQVADLVSAKCWYFGHYHTDCNYECETGSGYTGYMRFRALYRDIVRVC